MALKQSKWIRFKVYWHRFRKNHKIHVGFQHGVEIIWCDCGYYKPRISPRDGSENIDNIKHITDPELHKLLKDLRK